MSTLMEKMLMDMELRGFSAHTKEAYVSHVRHFAKHFGRPAEQLGETEIREFLHHGIAVRKLSTSYAIVCYCALRFFFETTLGREWDFKAIPRIKKGRRLPSVLSKEEILRLFTVTDNLKHKAAFMTAYSAGLRVSELAHLKIADTPLCSVVGIILTD